MQKFNELLSALKSHSNFIVTSHVNPDADALGSELAIIGVLNQLGKKYSILNTSITPYNLEFLDLKKEIQVYDSKVHDKLFEEADAAIFLDLNHINRTVRIEEQFKKFKGIKICIDHHTDPENFADLQIIDDSKSSTGEIIYDFIDSTEEVKLNNQIATAIYAAILTDTGSFRFSKTTPSVHRKVANLLEYGLSPELIFDKIYAQYEFSRIKLLGESLSTISITDSGKVSYMIVKQESLLKCNGVESDVDGFVNFALSTIGVEIGILFFELSDGIKISFRSKGTVPVNLLAKEFGGGGHVNASGSRLFDITLDEILPKVLESAEKLV